MSEENVEIVRRAYAAALRRPNPEFETVNVLFDRDHLPVPIATTVEGRTLRRADGFRQYLSDIDGVFRSWEAKIVEAEELDDEREGRRLRFRLGGPENCPELAGEAPIVASRVLLEADCPLGGEDETDVLLLSH